MGGPEGGQGPLLGLGVEMTFEQDGAQLRFQRGGVTHLPRVGRGAARVHTPTAQNSVAALPFTHVRFRSCSTGWIRSAFRS
jgi:hypothetical protein